MTIDMILVCSLKFLDIRYSQRTKYWHIYKCIITIDIRNLDSIRLQNSLDHVFC